MNKKDVMNIESLFILSTIAKYSGKKQASKEYNTSVDTINKYIENLENELGYKLLSSNGRGSVLTPRAENLMKKVNQIEDILNSIYTASVNKKDVKGEVRIGTSTAISSILPLHDINEFAEKYPNIILSFSTASTSEINENQISNVDVALSISKPNNSNLVIITSKKFECGLFAAPSYLSAYGYPSDLNDMLKNHRILHKQGVEKHISSWAEIVKQAKKLNCVSNSLFVLIEALRQGLGISILPMRFKKEGLVSLDNIKINSEMEIYLIAHKNTKDMPRIRAVLNYYRNLLADM